MALIWADLTFGGAGDSNSTTSIVFWLGVFVGDFGRLLNAAGVLFRSCVAVFCLVFVLLPWPADCCSNSALVCVFGWRVLVQPVLCLLRGQVGWWAVLGVLWTCWNCCFSKLAQALVCFIRAVFTVRLSLS